MTGAASGIGAAIARSLLEVGLVVVGLDLQAERLLSQFDGRLHARRCDLARERDIEEAFAWISREFGVIHVLVNNAGVTDYTPVIGKEGFVLFSGARGCE